MLDISYRAAPAVPAHVQKAERAHPFSGLQSWRVHRYLLHGLIIVVVSTVAATAVAIG